MLSRVESQLLVEEEARLHACLAPTEAEGGKPDTSDPSETLQDTQAMATDDGKGGEKGKGSGKGKGKGKGKASKRAVGTSDGEEEDGGGSAGGGRRRGSGGSGGGDRKRRRSTTGINQRNDHTHMRTHPLMHVHVQACSRKHRSPRVPTKIIAVNPRMATLTHIRIQWRSW